MSGCNKICINAFYYLLKFSRFTIHTMAKLNGIRVVLAEKDLKQQMATDKLGTNQATIS
mgnify:CR=1 FL=1